MLLTFSVTNFKCFKNKVTFSFEADEALDELYIFNEESRRTYHGVEYNTVNALYGANASGKSTLLEAMQLVFLLLSESSGSVEAIFNNLYHAFYDINQPIEFEITYLTETGEQVMYILRLITETSKHIVIVESESLMLLNESFRSLDDESALKTIFKRTLKKLTNKGKIYILRKNKEYLNDRISQNNIKSLPYYQLVLSNPFLNSLDAYRKPLQLLLNHPIAKDTYSSLLEPYINPEASLHALKKLQQELKSRRYKKQLLTFLHHADFSIVDVYIKDYRLQFKHSGGKDLSFNQQSEGTQKYFCLICTLLTLLNVSTSKRSTKSKKIVHPKTFYIDELEKSLHYKLASAIIDLFQHKETNPHGHRLVFTTHDTRFLQPRFLHGDQVWFISRDNDTDETLLESPVEYKDFDPFHLDKAYLLGSYSGVPNTKFDDERLEI